MPAYDFDLFVIGAGSGGVRAARLSASFGARVAIAEERYLGGTCVNVGCVPKKLFSYAAHFHEDFDDARGFGWRMHVPRFDWPTLRDNKNREIARLNEVYQRLLESAGVKLLRGRAGILDEHTVVVDAGRYTARHILVATGSRAVMPPVPGAELAVTSDQAFFLERFPRRALVVGGGYIAVEFASIFNGLGAETTLSYRGGRLLRGFDEEVRDFLGVEMQKKGVQIHFNSHVAEIVAAQGDERRVRFKDGSEQSFDLVMYATGRNPNSRGFGLEGTGVAMADNGGIQVDAEFRTSVPSICAIGDVIDRLKLTPVALAEGICVANSLFNNRPMTMDYAGVPTAVFSHPNVGTVGLTEAQARERFGAVDVYSTGFRALKHTLSGRDERTLMKLVVDGESGRVVGAHMVGPDAGETIQGIAVAIKCGATKAQFDATIGIHPTAAEEFVTLREKRAGSAGSA